MPEIFWKNMVNRRVFSLHILAEDSIMRLTAADRSKFGGDFVKFGIIGSAHGHVFEFVENMLDAGAEFCGVCADGTENTKKLCARYGVPAVDEPEELFAAGIEAAGCFGPSCERIKALEQCAAHGVHVMGDKPLVIDRAGLERLEAVMAGGRIQIGMMLTVRFMPCIAALKELLDGGAIGSLVHMEMLNPHKLSPSRRPDWHFKREEGGSVAADLLTHSVDLFRWLTNRSPIEAMSASVSKSILPEKPDFFDLAAAQVRTESKVTGYFRSDWLMAEGHWNWGDMRIFCVGTKGCIEVRATGDPLTRRPEVILYSPEAETHAVPLHAQAGNATCDFLDRIAGKPHCITQEDVLLTCRTCVALDGQAQQIRRMD